MNSLDLAHCPNPKCGSSDCLVLETRGRFWAFCTECNCDGPDADSVEAAKAIWDAMPRMSTIIAWQFQAAGAALALQKLMEAAQAMRDEQAAYEQYGSNGDSVTEAEAIFDGLLADARNAMEVPHDRR